jgi:23S rRNA U2552 (ribose-2'-O)-methylase RlmE/FtsJ
MEQKVPDDLIIYQTDDELTEQTIAFNKILGCSIIIKKLITDKIPIREKIKKHVREILENYKKHLLPFQTIDMKNNSEVRYGKADDMRKFVTAQNKLIQELRQYNINYDKLFHIGVTDFYHMMDRSEYKYLYQTEQHLLNHLKTCVEPVMDTIEKNGWNVVFIPDKVGTTPDVTNVKMYDNIKIIEPSIVHDTIDRIASLYDAEDPRIKNKKGRLYYSFYSMLDKYNVLKNRLDMLKEENRDIYNLTQYDVSKFFADRNIQIEKYAELVPPIMLFPKGTAKYSSKQLYDEITSCDIDINAFFSSITFDNYNPTLFHESIEKVKACMFNKYKLGQMLSASLEYVGDETTIKEQNIHGCATYIPTPANLYDNVVTCDCRTITDALKEELTKKTLNIRSFIEPILKNLDIPPNKYPPDYANCNVPDNNFKQIHDDGYKLLVEYMPEWVNDIKSNNLVKAMQDRTLLLGKGFVTGFFKRCGIIYESDPFINLPIPIDNITWSLVVNKMAVMCKLVNDLTFPIRLAIPCVNGVPSMTKYESFEQTQPGTIGSQYFIGTLVVKVNSQQRFKKGYEYYCLHVYVKPKKLISGVFEMRLYNFRGDRVAPGSTYAHLSVLHLELNTLHYFRDVKLLKDNEKLYYYKYSQASKKLMQVFVSKYAPEKLYKKLLDQNISHDTIRELINNLTLCELYKNTIGKFDIRDVRKLSVLSPGVRVEQHGGRGDHVDHVDHDSSSITSHITYIDGPPKLDNKIFPVDLCEKYVKFTKNIDVKNILYIIRPLTYVATKRMYDIVSREKSHFDINSVTYEKIIKILNKPLVSYKFVTGESIKVYGLMYNYMLCDNESKVLVISRNIYMLDGVNYYLKYKLMSNVKKNVHFHFCNVGNSDESIKVTSRYLEKSQIPYTSSTEPFNNSEIRKIIDSVDDKYNLVTYDVFFSTNTDTYVQYPDYTKTHNLYTLIPGIIIALSKLKVGGHLLLYFPLFSQKYMLDVLVYVSHFFKHLKFIHQQSARVLVHVCLFLNYNGNANLEPLYDINTANFKQNPEWKRTIEGPVLNTVFDSTIDTDKLIERYRKFCVRAITNSINIYLDAEQLSAHMKNDEYVVSVFYKNLYDTIIYLQEIGLEIPGWVNMPEMYENVVMTRWKRLEIDEVFKIRIAGSETINPSKEIQMTYDFNNSKLMSELVYQYLDTYNLDKYKSIELAVNNMQKNLNRKLFETYKINIAGKYVSRAWLKLYGLLHRTRLLRNHMDNDILKVLHICEAPGNFVNAINYYIKTNTHIKKYEWTAQSLKGSEIGDEYGFIAKTKEQWDFGKTKTGNITESENIKYYAQKYGDSDGVIGDCGDSWVSSTQHVNFGYYQLLYALLVPKKNGFFVLKTYMTNFDEKFMSILYVALSKYKRIMIYKSNINFWSPEIYLVGIGFTGITDSERSQILTSVENGTYLVPEVPVSFCKKYDSIIYRTLVDYIEMKKFIVFLAENKKAYDEYYPQFMKIINRKTIQYIESYMSHLPNIKKFISEFEK